MFSQIQKFYRFKGKCSTEQIVHAVQTSMAVKYLGGDRELRLAGLLHDIGHLLKRPVGPESGIDDKHELFGGIWLKHNEFPKSVYKPVMLHVDAKRYLCSKKWGYYEKLNKESKMSFKLQGGWMDWVEKENFEDQEFFDEAVMLRKADDMANNFIVHDIDFDELLKTLIN